MVILNYGVCNAKNASFACVSCLIWWIVWVDMKYTQFTPTVLFGEILLWIKCTHWLTLSSNLENESWFGAIFSPFYEKIAGKLVEIDKSWCK